MMTVWQCPKSRIKDHKSRTESPEMCVRVRVHVRPTNFWQRCHESSFFSNQRCENRITERNKTGSQSHTMHKNQLKRMRVQAVTQSSCECRSRINPQRTVQEPSGWWIHKSVSLHLSYRKGNWFGKATQSDRPQGRSWVHRLDNTTSKVSRKHNA